jgi:hypothetical protein
MTHIIQTFDAWWTVHPHLVDLALFFVALFASVFPDRSRRWLLTPAFHFTLGALRFMQRDAKNQLEIVRRINGDTFKLVAYIVYYSLHSIFWCFGTSFIFWAGINLLSLWQAGHPAPLPFGFLFLGALLGRAIKLYSLVGGLFNAEVYTAWLEKVVSDKLPG